MNKKLKSLRLRKKRKKDPIQLSGGLLEELQLYSRTELANTFRLGIRHQFERGLITAFEATEQLDEVSTWVSEILDN